VGDWLEVNGVVGQVIDINWRAVRLLTLEREMVVIPHKLISSEMIRNFTKPTPNHAERIQIGFSYNDPPNLARQVLKTTAMETKGVLLDPEPDVFTLGYADFAITYEVKFFIRDYGEIEQIRERFMTRVWYAAKRNKPIDSVPHSHALSLSRPQQPAEASRHPVQPKSAGHPLLCAAQPRGEWAGDIGIRHCPAAFRRWGEGDPPGAAG
jgi:small-conductance mechanosensitive channel